MCVFVCVCVYTGHGDLTNRFIMVCNNAVDWITFGVEHFKSEHAQHLDAGVSLPTNISLETEMSLAQADVAFLSDLLNFFTKAVQPAIRKVMHLFTV